MLRSWRAVLLLTVFLQLLGFGIVLPLLPYYGRDLGAGPGAIGALFAVYSLTQFLMAPLWGALADRFGRRPVLLTSVGWGFAGYLLFAFADSYGVLLASRFVAGLSAAVIGVSQAYLADRTPMEERARGMGLLGAAFGMGFVVGPAVGAVLSRWGYAAPGLVAAGLTLVNFGLALRWLPESLDASERRTAGRPPARRLGALAPLRPAGVAGVGRVLAILFLSTAAFSVLYPVFPLFLNERFGYGPLEAGALFSLVGLVAVVVQGGALGPLAAAFGERPLLRRGALLMAGGLAVLPLCRTPLQTALAVLPMALGFAVITPLAQTLLSRLAPPGEQARNLGSGHSVSSLARACGPLAGGYLLEHAGTPYPFWAAAALLLGAFGVAAALPARPAGTGAAAGARREQSESDARAAREDPAGPEDAAAPERRSRSPVG